MADHRFHHHIEDGGQQWVALSDASLSAEGLYVVPYLLYHHLQPISIPAEEAEGPGPHAISLQDVQATGPVQDIKKLFEINVTLL